MARDYSISIKLKGIDDATKVVRRVANVVKRELGGANAKVAASAEKAAEAEKAAAREAEKAAKAAKRAAEEAAKETQRGIDLLGLKFANLGGVIGGVFGPVGSVIGSAIGKGVDAGIGVALSAVRTGMKVITGLASGAGSAITAAFNIAGQGIARAFRFAFDAFRQGVAIAIDSARHLLVVVVGVFQEIAKKARWVALIIAGTLIGALIAAGEAARRSVNAFAEYEQQIVRSAAVTGLIGAELDQAKKAMFDFGLAVSRTTKTTADAVAKGMYPLASVGFDVGEIFAALPGVVALAEAQMHNLEGTSKLVTASLKQFQLGADQTNRVVNVFAAAISNSAANMGNLSAGLVYAGVPAQALGQSIELTTAAIATLNDAGRTGSMAGTGFANALSRLAKGGGKVKTGMEKLGLSMADVNVQGLGLIRVLRNIGKAGASYSDLLEMFELRAAPAMKILVDNVDKLEALEKQITGTNEAFRQQAEMLKSTQGLWDIVKSTWSEVVIKFGKQIAPIVRNVTKFLQAMKEWALTNKLVERAGKWFAYLADVVATLFKASYGDFFKRLFSPETMARIEGSLPKIADMVRSLFGLLSSWAVRVSDAMMRLWDAILGSNITVAFGKMLRFVGNIVDSIVNYITRIDWDKLWKGLMVAYGWVRAIFKQIVDVAVVSFAILKSIDWRVVFGTIWEIVMTVIGAFQTLGSNIAQALGVTGASAVEGFMGGLEALRSTVISVKVWLVDKLLSAANLKWLISWFTYARQWIVYMFQALLWGAQNPGAKAAGFFVKFGQIVGWVSAVISGNTDTMSEGFKRVYDTIKTGAVWVWNNLPQILTTVVTLVASIGKSLLIVASVGKAVGNVLGLAFNIVATVLSGILYLFGQLATGIVAVVRLLIKGLDWITAPLGTVLKLLSKIPGPMQNTFKLLADSAKPFTNMFKGAEEAMDNALYYSGAVTSLLGDTAVNKITGAWGNIKDLFSFGDIGDAWGMLDKMEKGAAGAADELERVQGSLGGGAGIAAPHTPVPTTPTAQMPGFKPPVMPGMPGDYAPPVQRVAFDVTPAMAKMLRDMTPEQRDMWYMMMGEYLRDRNTVGAAY